MTHGDTVDPDTLEVNLVHTFTMVSVKNETIAMANVHVLDRGLLLMLDVWVDPEHQRRGLGTRLMCAVIEQFGKQDIHLNAHGNAGRPLENRRLVDWLSGFGFQPVKDAPGRMVRPCDNGDKS